MKYIIFSIPLVLVIDLCIWTFIASMVRAANDLLVFAGYFILCTITYVHYLMIKYLLSKIKK